MNDCRETIQKLAQFGQRNQEELLSRQEQIRQAHEHLIQNSHSILEAQVLISQFGNMTSFTCSLIYIYWFFSYTQEEFRAKQANIFATLDKLYILHNAILSESRFIKAFFFYCCIVFLIYMLTSAKQTFSIRGQLYFGMISLLKSRTRWINLIWMAGCQQFFAKKKKECRVAHLM